MKNLLLFCSISLSFTVFAQVSLKVDVGRVTKKLDGYENGINVNYLMDGTFLNPSSFAQTAAGLKNMKVKMLRYPGGEKSDNYLWSAAPFLSASPRMAIKDTNAWPTSDSLFVDVNSADKLCRQHVLDFDEFMLLCNEVGAKPMIVVAYDAMYVRFNNVDSKQRPTKQQLIENAKQWVRYANVVKKFGIKYWMIGNESWNNPDYNGRTTVLQYALDLAEFAAAMKSVDPSIKIIANGKASWWPALLTSAAVKWIDVLGFSNYPVYNYVNGYEYYRADNVNLIGEVVSAQKAIEAYCNATDKARITLMPVEYNSIDWEERWAPTNNLGHALANFQMFGDLISQPKVLSAFMWTTRWTDTTRNYHVYNAMRTNGALNANALSTRIWGLNLLSTLVYSASADSKIKIYATYSPVSKLLNVMILNKDTKDKSVKLALTNYKGLHNQQRYLFKGTSTGDTAPKYAIASDVNLNGFVVPKTSVTVLTFVPYTT